MKRGAPLQRTTPIKRSRPKHPVGSPALRCASSNLQATDPAAQEFKRVEHGRCQVCGNLGWVRRHHVVKEQDVRREGGDPWDTRNAIWIGVGGEGGSMWTCDCHAQHHHALKHCKPWRIPIALIPDEAVAFAVALMGDDRARDYLRRFYWPVSR